MAEWQLPTGAHPTPARRCALGCGTKLRRVDCCTRCITAILAPRAKGVAMKFADARVWRALPPSSSLRNSCDERTALLYCLRFDGGMLLDVVACARIERTRRKCIGQETRRPFRLLFVATQSLHILRNMVHRVAKAAENRLRCRVVGTSPILLPQKRGVAPQKQRALRIWGRRRTLQQRGEQKKKTFGGALAANTPAPLSAGVTVSAYVF